MRLVIPAAPTQQFKPTLIHSAELPTLRNLNDVLADDDAAAPPPPRATTTAPAPLLQPITSITSPPPVLGTSEWLTLATRASLADMHAAAYGGEGAGAATLGSADTAAAWRAALAPTDSELAARVDTQRAAQASALTTAHRLVDLAMHAAHAEHHAAERDRAIRAAAARAAWIDARAATCIARLDACAAACALVKRQADATTDEIARFDAHARSQLAGLPNAWRASVLGVIDEEVARAKDKARDECRRAAQGIERGVDANADGDADAEPTASPFDTPALQAYVRCAASVAELRALQAMRAWMRRNAGLFAKKDGA
jgi:hypothetical protein